MQPFLPKAPPQRAILASANGPGALQPSYVPGVAGSFRSDMLDARVACFHISAARVFDRRIDVRYIPKELFVQNRFGPSRRRPHAKHAKACLAWGRRRL